jgi:hypothetical protein
MCFGFIWENIGSAVSANKGMFIVVSEKKTDGGVDTMLCFVWCTQRKN